MRVDAVYFDGETARDHAVSVQRAGSNLEFQGQDVHLTLWSIAGLHPIDPPTDDQPFRITHDNKPGARLVLRDRDFINDLVAQNSHLKGGYSWRHLGQVLGWTAGGLAALAGLGYLAMTVLPQQLAGLLPQGMRDSMGEQVVKSIVGSAKKCDTAEANSAIASMMSALAQGGNDLPPVSIGVYDMDLVNAFAAGGGRVVLTKGLINGAKDADEVAGVLAHELGHIYHLHPEAQLVRISGLQILISVVSGGGGSDIMGNAAGLAALLRYNRAAEREADTYARSIMGKSSVDPTGLKRFFERVMKIEGKPAADADTKPSAFDRIGNVLSTHPDTEERIRDIVPLPAGQTPVKVMTDAEWDALKKACG
jgi:beta-barrel assembly-enhancing protease